MEPAQLQCRKPSISQSPSALSGLVQRTCTCGGTPGSDGECASCRAKRLDRQRAAGGQPGAAVAPPIVHEVLQQPGQPLDSTIRAFMEPRFGHDFSQVRVHTDARAGESSQAIDADAYTVGRDVVFGPGRYTPYTPQGRTLLAHELTHVVQQRGEVTSAGANLVLGGANDPAEQQADHIARSLTNGDTHGLLSGVNSPVTSTDEATTARTVRRQFVTPLGQGGGFGGLMDRDRRRTQRLMSTPFQVCSRPLQIGGFFANHAYIEAPPHRYAVIGPRCTPTDGGRDSVLRGTVTRKWDNSPDPCDQSPVNRVPCEPAPGVTDVGQCLRDAYNSYNSPMLYKLLGPNSNTFAGTLARTCCANMVPKPRELGRVPGWDDPPAPSRPGNCPEAPSCD